MAALYASRASAEIPHPTPHLPRRCLRLPLLLTLPLLLPRFPTSFIEISVAIVIAMTWVIAKTIMF